MQRYKKPNPPELETHDFKLIHVPPMADVMGIQSHKQDQWYKDIEHKWLDEHLLDVIT